jgi:ABC-2 type transport system permease protein
MGVLLLPTRKKRRSASKRVAAAPFVRALQSPLRACIVALWGMWSLAWLDLLLWRRMPIAIASALIPPIGMAVMLVVLSLTVTQEPLALVIQSQGAYSKRMTEIIEADTDAYYLSETTMEEAQRLLADQEIAAIIVIPPNFDQKATNHEAQLRLILNNVDIDFADDIRRSVERSVGQFDAPALALEDEEGAAPVKTEQEAPNPYHIGIEEHDLRKTNVDFLSYQVLPVFVLLVLNTGLLGTALLCAQDVERGTGRHLALAPVSAWVLVAGRLLGGLIASLAALIPAVGLCLLAGFIAPPADHWGALAALFVATAVCAAGIGAIVGTLLRGTRNIVMASSVLATYLFFLGGGFTTIAFLPQWLRNISAFNPIRYSIDGMRQALFYPDLSGFSTDMTVLIGTALVAILVGSFVVRRSWSS